MLVNKMYPIWHRKCKATLFYYKEQPKPGNAAIADLAVMLDCTKPSTYQPFECPNCGLIQTHELGFDEVQKELNLGIPRGKENEEG